MIRMDDEDSGNTNSFSGNVFPNVSDSNNPHLAQAFAREERPPVRTATGVPLEVLTAREREVAAVVARAATGREVARLLGISPRTAQKHLRQIYRKLDLTSRAELIVRLSRS